MQHGKIGRKKKKKHWDELMKIKKKLDISFLVEF
jgi:hypothetical protein